MPNLTGKATSSQNQAAATQDDEVPKECYECDAPMSDKAVLRLHFAYNLPPTEKAFVCQQCQAVYFSNCSFEAHLRSHTGAPKHICAECGISLISASSLTVHMLNHRRSPTVLDAWRCQKCYTFYCAREALIAHVEEVHCASSYVKCPACPRTFRNQAAFIRHRTAAHAGLSETPDAIFRCPTCYAVCRDRSQLIEHLKEVHYSAISQYVRCPICGRLGDNRSDLAMHYENVHDKPLEANHIVDYRPLQEKERLEKLEKERLEKERLEKEKLEKEKPEQSEQPDAVKQQPLPNTTVSSTKISVTASESTDNSRPSSCEDILLVNSDATVEASGHEADILDANDQCAIDEAMAESNFASPDLNSDAQPLNGPVHYSPDISTSEVALNGFGVPAGLGEEDSTDPAERTDFDGLDEEPVNSEMDHLLSNSEVGSGEERPSQPTSLGAIFEAYDNGPVLSPLPAAVSSNTASSLAVAPPSCVATYGGSNNETQNFLSKGAAAVIIRMRGLPYDCTTAQIVEFFNAGGNVVDVLDGEGGILFVNTADGSATGDAFVLVSSEEDAVKALSKDKDSIGSRYIELSRSTTAEVQEATCSPAHSAHGVAAPAAITCIAVNGPATNTANTLAKAAVTSETPAPKKASSSDDSSSPSGDQEQTAAVKQVNSDAGISQAAIASTKPVSTSNMMPSHSKQQPAKDDTSPDSSSEVEKKTTESAASIEAALQAEPTATSSSGEVSSSSSASSKLKQSVVQQTLVPAKDLSKSQAASASTATFSIDAKVGITAANKCTVYHCDLCDFYALEPNAVKIHLGSTAHLKAVGLLGTATQEFDGLSTSHSVEAKAKNKVFHCPLCNKVTTDKTTFDGHLAGNPHRTAVASGATAQASLLILPMASLAMTSAATASINKATPKVPLKSAAKESSSSDSAALPQAHVSESLNHTASNQNASKQSRNDDCESGEFESSSDDDNAKLSSASAARLNASASGLKTGRGKAVRRRLRHRKYLHRQRQIQRVPLSLDPNNLQAISGLDGDSVSPTAGEGSAFLSPADVMPAVSPMPDAPRHVADRGRDPNARLFANNNDNGT